MSNNLLYFAVGCVAGCVGTLLIQRTCSRVYEGAISEYGADTEIPDEYIVKREGGKNESRPATNVEDDQISYHTVYKRHSDPTSDDKNKNVNNKEENSMEKAGETGKKNQYGIKGPEIITEEQAEEILEENVDTLEVFLNYDAGAECLTVVECLGINGEDDESFSGVIEYPEEVIGECCWEKLSLTWVVERFVVYNELVGAVFYIEKD